MLEILVIVIWGFLTTYTIWYFTKAKNYAPITLNEARLLWKIHKRNMRCTSNKWRSIQRKGRIIGFECECGYKHIQKRPIVANTPALQLETANSQLAFDKLHTSYKSK